MYEHSTVACRCMVRSTWLWNWHQKFLFFFFFFSILFGRIYLKLIDRPKIYEVHVLLNLLDLGNSCGLPTQRDGHLATTLFCLRSVGYHSELCVAIFFFIVTMFFLPTKLYRILQCHTRGAGGHFLLCYVTTCIQRVFYRGYLPSHLDFREPFM